MQLNTVESGLDCIAGGGREVFDGLRDLLTGDLARRNKLLHSVVCVVLTVSSNRARCNRLCIARQKIGQRDASGVEDLHKNFAATRVYRFGYGSPAFNLSVSVDSGCADIAFRHGQDVCRLGDDEPGGSALTVIRGGVVRLNSFVISATARHWTHDDPVVEFHISDLQRVEQCRHKFSF